MDAISIEYQIDLIIESQIIRWTHMRHIVIAFACCCFFLPSPLPFTCALFRMFNQIQCYAAVLPTRAHGDNSRLWRCVSLMSIRLRALHDTNNNSNNNNFSSDSDSDSSSRCTQFFWNGSSQNICFDVRVFTTSQASQHFFFHAEFLISFF